MDSLKLGAVAGVAAVAGAAAMYAYLKQEVVREAKPWARAVMRWAGEGLDIDCEIDNPTNGSKSKITFGSPNCVEATLAAYGSCALIDVVDHFNETGALASARCEVTSERHCTKPRTLKV